jgi:D-sedoheptulose 7-phosphate isomerase
MSDSILDEKDQEKNTPDSGKTAEEIWMRESAWSNPKYSDWTGTIWDCERDIDSLERPKLNIKKCGGSTRKFISHLYEVSNTLTKLDWLAIEQMAALLEVAPLSYAIGNGGSAATASHFAADLAKAAGIRILSLDNLAAFTAWSNDQGVVNGFSGPLLRLHHGNSDEVLVAISTSGQSPNIIRAVQDFSGPVVALTGRYGGLLANSKVAVHITVDSDVIEVIEDCHMAICHAVVRLLKL